MDFFGAFAILDPAGVVALAERGLMVQAVLFMLIVVVPVYLLLFFFAYYYRSGNKKATYLPNWRHAKVDELIWWAIPFEIVLILGALTWTSTHELDPRRPLPSDAPPLVIQVVALPWKWLFIYPKEDIATVGYVALPIERPVRFEITADAPMNSFWIPRLGGQIYAMTGMVTVLNLVASETGVYEGLSANYSGDGFAHMRFSVHAVSAAEFEAWAESTGAAPKTLTTEEYWSLARPGVSGVAYYGDAEEGLHARIVDSFNAAGSHGH